MSVIIPVSSITRKVTRLIDFDAQNAVDGSTEWNCGVSNLVYLTSVGVLNKDASGVYSAAGTALGGLVGTTPELSGILLMVAIWRGSTTASGHGSLFVVGSDSGGVRLNATGSSDMDGVALSGNATLAPGNLTNVSEFTARATVFDLTAVANPIAMRAEANQSQVAISRAHTTTAGGAFPAGAPSNAIQLGFHTTNAADGRRGVRYLVGRLDALPHPDELLQATAQMASTGLLYNKWSVV